jgi:Bacteriophage baseplate protein W
MANGATDTAPPKPSTGTGAPPALVPSAFPGYGQMSDVGNNWRIKFFDADGLPLNMLSFEEIDFGAIAYKEIFQNVKTILATPLYSAPLERLLGIDQTIVDLPIQQAQEATVAIIDALYFWEPRAEIVNIVFSGDVIAGHLIVACQLRIKNVIYGTETPYDRNNIFDTPSRVSQQLPPPMPTDVIAGPPGPQGPQGPPGMGGAPGQRGSMWFTGTTDPVVGALMTGVLPNDMYLNVTTGAIFQFDGVSGTWRKLT